MKNITLWQRLRQVSISTSLRCAFLMGALLTLIVSSVSLYSWHEQSSQIRYSLDEYFPRIHSAFLIEGNLNLVVDQLNEFLQAPNTTVRLQLRTQIIQHLDTIERLSRGLSSRERQQLTVILQDSRSLLSGLDRALYNMFLLREKVSELSARIDWLHDDFTTELNSLVQDFTWQQGTLLDQIASRQGDTAQYLKRSREVQNEQQQVYTLARIENQIVDDLRDRLNELKSGRDDDTQVETHLRYFENLKKTADENIRMLDDWPGTITLRQTIDELLDMGIVKNKMPDTMREYVTAQKALEDASRTREATLGRFRTLLEAQLGSTHQQMQMFNQRMEQIVRVSGGLILVATALALLLAWVFNHYFIRSRLVKRFTLLNQAVVQIGLGGTETTIPVYGNDELGRIAGLLRHTLGQLNVQKQQLEQEITDRKVIEADLRATQDELIQTAKLAVRQHGIDMATCADNPSGAACQKAMNERDAVGLALATGAVALLPGSAQAMWGLGASANAGISYLADGTVDPANAAIAGWVNVFSMGNGLAGTVGWNAAGGALGNWIDNNDPLSGAISNGIGSAAGYGIGKGITWGTDKITNAVGKWVTNGWDPKYDPTWIKYAEVNRNDIIREGMKPSNVPGTAGDIGGSIGSELGGKVTDKVSEELKK